MGWFEGMLGGFADRKYQMEAENIRQADLAAERESRVYQALLNSSDTEIQALAAAGLLDSTQPKRRKGGIRGWLGEMETSPHFQQIQALIRTPVEKAPGELPTLGHTEYPTIGTPPPSINTQPPSLGDAPAGTPAQSLTEPGAAPAPNVPQAPPPAAAAPQAGVAPVAPAAPPAAAAAPRPQPKQIPATVGKPPVFGPREVFPSAGSVARAQAYGQYSGRAMGLQDALRNAKTPEERQIALELAGFSSSGAGGGVSSVQGEVVDPATGQTRPEFAVFNRPLQAYVYPAGHAMAGQPIPGFRPRTTTGSQSSGTDRDALARSMFGSPFASLTQPQQQQVQAELPKFAGQMAESRGLGSGRAAIAKEFNSPIGPTAAQIYNVSPTTTLGQLSGIVGLSTEQKDRMYAVGQIDVTLDEIEALIPKVFPNVPEGMAGAFKTAWSLGMQRLAGDGDLAALNAAIEGSLAQVAQLSGQPGSRLSDNDIKMARAELANLTPALFGGDTIITAQARVGVLRKLFERAQASIPTQLPPGIGAPPPIPSMYPGGQPVPQAAAPAVGAQPPSRGSAPAAAGGKRAYMQDDGTIVWK